MGGTSTDVSLAEGRPRLTTEAAVDGFPIRVPVLVIAGDEDELVGSPQGLADRIPGARALTVSGNHLSAVTDPAFAGAVVAFLAEQDARPTVVR